jgi:hypothetical protein
LLTAYRKTATVPQATVTTKVHQSLDVHSYFTAQVAFDRNGTDLPTDTLDFRFGQIPNLGIWCDTGRCADLVGTGFSDTINVGQAHPGVLLNRYIDSCNTSHVVNSCQLYAACVNSTLYLIQSVGKSLNFIALTPAPIFLSALSLLMLLLTANDEQNAFASYNFAVSADLFY